MAEFNQFPIDIHDDASITSDDDTFCLDDFIIGNIFFYYFIGDRYGSYGIVDDIRSDCVKMKGAMNLFGSHMTNRTTGYIRFKDGKWFHDGSITREIKVKILGPPKITYEEIRGEIIEQLIPIERSDLPLNSYTVINAAGCICADEYDGKIPLVIKAKTKLGAIVGWLDWQRKHITDNSWFGHYYILIVDFIGVDEDQWLEVLEKSLGNNIKLLEIEETVMFPSPENVKSASKN